MRALALAATLAAVGALSACQQAPVVTLPPPAAPSTGPQVVTKEDPLKLKDGDRCTTAWGPGRWSAAEQDCWITR